MVSVNNAEREWTAFIRAWLPARPSVPANTPSAAKWPRVLQPEQITQLHEQGVCLALQPAEPERVLILHVAAVPREHYGSGNRLIAEQRIEVEVVVRTSLGAGHRRWSGNQNRRAGPTTVTRTQASAHNNFHLDAL